MFSACRSLTLSASDIATLEAENARLGAALSDSYSVLAKTKTALRPIPLGKRNWLFTSSEVGAQRVGIIQSLLVTCRLHADPCTYLVAVLQRISAHPTKRAIDLIP